MSNYRSEDARSRDREGTWSLLFDLTGHSDDTDGIANPAWMVAADRYNVVGGDMGRIGWQYVAVLAVESNGDHRGRDGQGRAVRLVPVASDAGHADDCEMMVRLLSGERCTCGFDTAASVTP